MGQTFEIFPTKIYRDYLDRRITNEELEEVIKLGQETHDNFGNLITNNHNYYYYALLTPKAIYVRVERIFICW